MQIVGVVAVAHGDVSTARPVLVSVVRVVWCRAGGHLVSSPCPGSAGTAVRLSAAWSIAVLTNGNTCSWASELFAGLRPEHEFFEEFGFISADDLPGFESILKRMERAGVESLLQPPLERLLSLALKLVAARDPLDLLDDKMQ